MADFTSYIPADMVLTALLNNCIINIFKRFYFMLMTDVTYELQRDILVIIVFLTGGGLYGLLSSVGLFEFAVSSCVLSPVLSVLFYEAGFYAWLVRTLKAFLDAISSRLTEAVHAFRKK